MGLDDFYRKDPSPLHNHFSVIGKIGETFISQEEIFYIGMDYAGIVRKAGTLFIGLNNSNWVLTGTGAFEVEIKLIRTMR